MYHNIKQDNVVIDIKIDKYTSGMGLSPKIGRTYIVNLFSARVQENSMRKSLQQLMLLHQNIQTMSCNIYLSPVQTC